MKTVLRFALPFLLVGLGTCDNFSQNQTYNCCVNRQFFSCPELNSFIACVGYQDPTACERDRTQDYGCQALNTFTCCVGTAFYTCPDVNTVTTCLNKQDASACTREVGKDAACPL